jgi:conjugal transfer pilus assembly protein TraE
MDGPFEKRSSIAPEAISIMNDAFRSNNIQFLLFQRNVFVALTLLLAVALVINGSFLFFKHERVVVVPPIVEREFWVDTHTVSPSYLEQFGYFLGQLLLTKSSQSAASQRAIILRHTDPAYAGKLKQRLIEEEQILQKQSTSYVFYPIETQANLDAMSLKLTGERIVFVGGKQVSSSAEEYRFRFSYDGTHLLLTEIISEVRGNPNA